MSRPASCLVLALGLMVSSACDRPQVEPGPSRPLRIAVATNFRDTAEHLVEVFEARHPSARVTLSAGSSGKLYAQIKHGAPFDVFLSADADRPARLEAEGSAIPGTRMRYALGQLVLFGPALAGSADGASALRGGDFQHVAIAHPDTAPYGAAAKQVLTKLGLWNQLRPKIAIGDNVGQAYQFVVSGNAELGFVSRSLVPCSDEESCWPVPEALHEPIQQDAIALRLQDLHPLAKSFLDFLATPAAKNVINQAGYLSE